MPKKLLLSLGGFVLLMMLWVSGLAIAQNTTAVAPVPTSNPLLIQPTARPTIVGTPTTNVNYFFVVCDNRAILDLDGIIGRNLDVYIQVFRGFGASGTALTNEIRVQIDGTFQSSSVLQYNGEEKLLLGQLGSAKLRIANETTGKATFETIVDDAQDGCAEPQYTSTTINGSTASSGGTIVGTPVVDPITNVTRIVIGDSGIFKPDGTMLNLIYAAPREDVVQIGVRPSEIDVVGGRTSNPGVIFAECDAFPEANPGRLFDTDNLTLYWSWFAKTPKQVEDHINNALYDVQIDSRGALKVTRSEIKQLSDGNYWVFYTADLSNGWQPGNYRVNFRLAWSNVISDGFDDYGPGTGANESFDRTCTYTIEANPFGQKVNYKNPNTPITQP